MKQFITLRDLASNERKRRKGIKTYQPISLLRRGVGYALIGYGLLTFVLPSGSQLALIGGCLLLGIPFKVLMDKIKLYIGRILFVLRVICSKKRLIYEFRRAFI